MADQTPSPQMPAQTPARDQAKSNKRFVIGCVSVFGCSLLLFIGVLFAFLGFSSTESPIFSFLGVPPSEVVNVLITLVHMIFLVLVFISFIFVVVGFFKIATARKDDKAARQKGMMFTFGSAAIMVLLIFIWIFAFFYLNSRRTPTVRTAIITVPEKTINLTAPVKISFDASKLPINKRNFEILSYGWDFGDGTKLTGNPQTHTFTEVGNFKVTLTATVKEKSTGKQEEVTFTRDVTIQNVLANVIIKASATKGVAPLTVQFDGSESNSPNGEITAYAWDLDEDGQYDDDADATAETTFDKIGAYTVKLRVTDSTGAFAAGELEIEATEPDTPIAVITVEGVSDDQLTTNTSYVFSAAASTSPTGTVEKYEWDFGDGKSAKTRTATHIYKEAGIYEAVLEVTDSKGKKGESAQRFTVSPPAASPLANLKTTPAAANGVVNGQAPFTVIFDGSESMDVNDNIVEFSWDFDGDGNRDDANAVTSYAYSKAGTYNATLTVIDSTDLKTTAQVVVVVAPAGIKADLKAEPVAGTVPLTVNFDASGSSYAEGKIVSYEWDFGDGTPKRLDEAAVSHQYTSVGTFTVKAVAIGADNKRAETGMLITVRPIPIKACFEPSSSEGKTPLEVSFDPTCSTGTVIKYRWNFAGLSTSTERKPSYTFKDPGEYTVALEVSDAQNVVNSYSTKIMVK